MENKHFTENFHDSERNAKNLLNFCKEDLKLPIKFELALEQVFGDWIEFMKIQKNEERAKKLKRILKIN